MSLPANDKSGIICPSRTILLNQQPYLPKTMHPPEAQLTPDTAPIHHQSQASDRDMQSAIRPTNTVVPAHALTPTPTVTPSSNLTVPIRRAAIQLTYAGAKRTSRTLIYAGPNTNRNNHQLDLTQTQPTTDDTNSRTTSANTLDNAQERSPTIDDTIHSIMSPTNKPAHAWTNAH